MFKSFWILINLHLDTLAVINNMYMSWAVQNSRKPCSSKILGNPARHKVSAPNCQKVLNFPFMETCSGKASGKPCFILFKGPMSQYFPPPPPPLRQNGWRQWIRITLKLWKFVTFLSRLTSCCMLSYTHTQNLNVLRQQKDRKGWIEKFRDKITVLFIINSDLQ